MTIREELKKLYWEKVLPTVDKEQETIEFILSTEVMEVLLPLYEVAEGNWMSRQVSVKEGEL